MTGECRAPRSLLLAALAATLLAGWPEAAGARGAPSPPDTVHADSLRTLQPEDLFRLHRVGEVRFSPEGRDVAFERVRAGEEGAVTRLPNVPQLRSDVWIAPVEGGAPRPLTDGGADGTGWFHPRWSPDGQRLALLSVRGNEIRAWIWERRTGELRRATDRAVHFNPIGPLLVRWLSDHELALAARPEGAPERGRLLADFSRPGLFAMRRWREAWSGREATADVLDSGLGAGPDSLPQGGLPRSEVLVVDTDGSARTLARGRWGLVRPSPDHRWLATFSDPPVASMPQDRPLSQLMVFGTRPGTAPLDDGATPSDGRPDTGSTYRPADGSVRLGTPVYGSLRWAPDGHAYAYLTRAVDEEGEPLGTRVALVRPGEGGLQLLEPRDRRIAGLAWTGASELLVRARWQPAGENDPRVDWWRARPGEEWENLTRGMASVPSDLLAAGDEALGVADGDLWRIGAEPDPRAVTQDFGPAVDGIVWPDPSGSIAGGGPESVRRPGEPLAVLAESAGGPELWLVEAPVSGTPTFRRIPTPDRAVEPRALSPTAAAAAFSTVDSTGTWLWMTRGGGEERGGAERGAEARVDAGGQAPGGPVDTLVAADRWLPDVRAGEARRLAYSTAEGRELTAWMILPPDRTEGERHPTVTYIYPGQSHGDSPPASTRLNVLAPWRAMQLLASRGYAVLLPSVPLPREADDIRSHLEAAVLPAVDRAVEAGLADSSRVGLMGHSYGGYGVNLLVTGTDRFGAAVSAAGVSDLRARYGTFDARGRHGHMTDPRLLQVVTMAWAETGQGRMGAPPWEAPDRYRQNSPMTHVEEVETPLMLIHGDRDYMPDREAEMLFTGLLRQDKPARLVRYFGEAHVVRGRANVLDMWDRIYGWFDRFLGEEEDGQAGR